MQEMLSALNRVITLEGHHSSTSSGADARTARFRTGGRKTRGGYFRPAPSQQSGDGAQPTAHPWATAPSIDKIGSIRPVGQDAAPSEPRAGLPLVEFHVLDHVVRGVRDEVPGALAAYHLDELVLESGPAHSRVHGDGPSNRERAFLVVVVDRVGLLGLVENRLTLAVLGRGQLEGLDMHLGAALEYVQISRRLNLELLQLEKDHDIRLEVTRGVGRVGPLGMTLNPGPHFLRIDHGDLLHLLDVGDKR